MRNQLHFCDLRLKEYFNTLWEETSALKLIQKTVDTSQDFFTVDFFAGFRLEHAAVFFEEGQDAEVALVVGLLGGTFWLEDRLEAAHLGKLLLLAGDEHCQKENVQKDENQSLLHLERLFWNNVNNTFFLNLADKKKWNKGHLTLFAIDYNLRF